MPTANLNIEYLSTGQSQKEVTVNAGFQKLDGAIAGRLAKDCSALAPAYALTEAEGLNAFISLTGAPTAALTLTLPSARAFRWVLENNLTGAYASVSVMVAGGGVITVGTGQKVALYFNGTTLSLLGAPGGTSQAFATGKPAANQVVASYLANDALTRITGAQLSVLTPPSAAATFTLTTKSTNGVSTNVGTLVVAAGQRTGSVTGLNVALATGVVLVITAPAAQDAALSDTFTAISFLKTN